MTIFDNLANANPIFRHIADALNGANNPLSKFPIIGPIYNKLHGIPNQAPMQPPVQTPMQPPAMFPGFDRLQAKLQQPPLGGIFGSSPMQPPSTPAPRRNMTYGLGGY